MGLQGLVPEEAEGDNSHEDVAHVAAAELADVTLMWQTVERDSRLRGSRRARTSVTSLRSSGDPPFISLIHARLPTM